MRQAAQGGLSVQENDEMRYSSVVPAAAANPVA